MKEKSILLIGLGRFGRHIAIKLHEMGHQVMAVDRSEARINAVLPYATNAQIGDSTDAEFVSSLGIPNYDACIVAIGDDFQSSLETASLLSELGARKVIARASKGQQEKFLLRNGADEVVYPEKQLAAWTAIRCTSDLLHLRAGHSRRVERPDRRGAGHPQASRHQHSGHPRKRQDEHERHARHRAAQRQFHARARA